MAPRVVLVDASSAAYGCGGGGGGGTLGRWVWVEDGLLQQQTEQQGAVGGAA